MNEIVRELDRIGCEYYRKYFMKRLTSLRVGGPADLIVYPRTLDELLIILNVLSYYDTKWIVLGGGSNTIIADAGFRGVVIVTKRLKKITLLDDGGVLAETGAVMGTILNTTIRAGLTGFEFAAGIPGTIGGGVFMNAGANGGEIKEVVDKVWIWENGKEYVLSRDDLGFEYRKSNIRKGSVVTKALFKLGQGNKDFSQKLVKEFLDKRSRTQPIKTSNTGSIFKNPPEIPAGKLLDELGFKGVTVGGAKFSEIHANFIINSGHATTTDVLTLIKIAREEAHLKTGINLETEVRIVEGDLN